jgi:hypothetical protein
MARNVLTTVTCAALVPTDNLKSGVRRGGKGRLWLLPRSVPGQPAG